MMPATCRALRTGLTGAGWRRSRAPLEERRGDTVMRPEGLRLEAMLSYS